MARRRIDQAQTQGWRDRLSPQAKLHLASVHERLAVESIGYSECLFELKLLVRDIRCGGR